MYLTQYEPWRLLEQWNNAINSNRPASNAKTNDPVDWHPAVDIQDNADAFVLHADIPGVKSDDIDVTAEKGVLTIKGERNTVSTEKDAQYERTERVHGVFMRQFQLPDSVDTEAITATADNGVLVVTLPKSQQLQPKRIKVQTH